MTCCAIADCMRAGCRPCWWARQPIRGGKSATTHEAIRDDAKVVPKKPREKPLWMPKKKHRVGPHR